jgi:hypothetical protein
MISVARRNQVLKYVGEEVVRILNIRPKRDLVPLPSNVQEAVDCLDTLLVGNFPWASAKDRLVELYQPKATFPTDLQPLASDVRQAVLLTKTEGALEDAIAPLEKARVDRLAS